MPDVTLVKAAANTAIEEMTQANKAMVDALQDMLDRIRPLQHSFQGTTATAWNDFQNTVNTSISQMNHAFGQGAQALERMVDAQIEADLRGGQIMSH
ncbi:WXG100 family type VII secretion target [Streptomyces sp. NPDC018057]|uniref:WXG100 family type VII secretion target n=1 Tax=unclassified Streptomyces TaxID=2593676 RepID=UPI0037974F49